MVINVTLSKYISRFLFSLFACLFMTPVQSADLKLLEVMPQSIPSVGEVPVEINQNLEQLRTGDVIRFDTHESGSVNYIVDKIIRHKSGSLTIAGYYLNTDYRVVITLRDNRVFKGSVQTPGGKLFLIEQNFGKSVLLSADQFQPEPNSYPDFEIPSSSSVTKQRPKIERSDDEQAFTEFSQIDLLVLHTPTLKDATAKIDHMVAVANLAYQDSGVDAELRLVHLAEIDYSVSTGLDEAVPAMRFGEPPFQDLGAMRDEYGADIVFLVRPLKSTAQGGCGFAYLIGANGANMNRPDLGFGSVSEGIDRVTNRMCIDTNLVHEIGHLMGSAHDLEHQSVVGKYSYSNGYGIEDEYGTVMAYFRPNVGKFSSPKYSCDGTNPCGVSAGGPSEADNVTSLNLTRHIIAGFREAVSYSGDIESGLWGIDSELARGEAGRGFQLVYQGDTLLLTYFGYDVEGGSLFYQAYGPVSSGQFKADLLLYENGTVMGSPYRPASLVQNVGFVEVVFTSSQTATIRLPGEAEVNMSLFVFDLD